MNDSAPELAWLAGSWEGEAWGGRMEEHWTEPRGGTLLGMNRVVRDGKTVHKEFIWIELGNGSATLWVRVFREPEETVRYEMAEAVSTSAVFRNPGHGRLHTMEYRRNGDSLEIVLLGSRKGGDFREAITLRRQ